MIQKRQSAFIACLLFFFVTVFPAKSVLAFGPLALVPIVEAVIVQAGGAAAGGGAVSVYSAAAASTGGYIAAGAAGAIGLIGAYFAIKDAQDNYLRVPLGTAPQNTVPAPLAPPTATAVQSSKWCITYPAGGSDASGTYCGADKASACPGVMINGGCYDNYFGPSYQGGWTVTSGCPSGYSSSGGGCTLANARQVNDDKTCDMLLTNGQFATADDLNCPNVATGAALSPLLRDGKMIAYGQNSSGQPLMFEVTPGVEKFIVKITEQVTTAQQTQLQETSLTVDAATGVVTSVQTATSPGSISAPSGSAVPTTLAPGEVAAPANTPTANVSPGVQLLPDIKFPSDYARTGEAQNAAKPIQDALTNSADLPDPVSPEYVDPWASTFGNLKGWSLPGHTSACPVGSFQWNGQSFVIDSHCQLVAQNFGILQGAMYVVWVVLALFVVLGA